MASYAVSYINKPQSVFALHNNENGRMGNKVEILYPLGKPSKKKTAKVVNMVL